MGHLPNLVCTLPFSRFRGSVYVIRPIHAPIKIRIFCFHIIYSIIMLSVEIGVLKGAERHLRVQCNLRPFTRFRVCHVTGLEKFICHSHIIVMLGFKSYCEFNKQ